MDDVSKKNILKEALTKARAKKLGDRLGVNWKNIDIGQFHQGLKVEREHQDITKGDPAIMAKIALAHIKEIPDYYTRLEKMEKEGETKD